MSKSNEIYEMRRADIMKAYARIAPECWTQKAAWKRIAESEAPRFYVTPKQAYQVIMPMIRGDFSAVEAMSPQRQRMYRALYDIVMELASRPTNRKMSLWALMPWAVTSPAPEFYVSPYWVRQIWSEERTGKRYRPNFKKRPEQSR